MSFLYYITFKYVVIRDRRIGAAYYLLVLAVFMYAFSEIIFRKGYLEYDKAPLGSLRLLLKDSKSRPSSAQEERYCCQAHGVSGNDSNKPGGQECWPCQVVDAKEISWPVESRSVTIATFIKDKWQRRNFSGVTDDDDSSENSASYVTGKKESYYTLAPETVLLKVEHSFVASQFTDHSSGQEQLALSNRLMDGYLYSMNGSRLRTISTEGHADKIGLDELFHAAGLEEGLDTLSDSPNGAGRSVRSRGCVLRVSIVYENDRDLWIGTGAPKYGYHVRHVPYADYRMHQLVPIFEFRAESDKGSDSETCHGEDCRDAFRKDARLIRKRYGVHIAFDQSGKLGMFSWSSLLSKLVSSICFISIIPTLIDTAILYIVPSRSRYRDAVFEDESHSDDNGDQPAGESHKETATPSAGDPSSKTAPPVTSGADSTADNPVQATKGEDASTDNDQHRQTKASESTLDSSPRREGSEVTQRHPADTSTAEQ